MTAKERREREHGRSLAAQFAHLVTTIVTAPAPSRDAFDEVMEELGGWCGWEKLAPPTVTPPPVPRRPFGDN
jgi:hypothetical protein